MTFTRFHRRMIPLAMAILVLSAPETLVAGPASPFDQAVTSYERGDIETARRLWEAALADGDWTAARSLGTLYRRGLGGLQDDVRAVAYYRQAVEHGVANAELNLAEMMIAGSGTPVDVDGALALLRRAAEAGNPLARLRLDDIEAAHEAGHPPPPLPPRHAEPQGMRRPGCSGPRRAEACRDD